MTAQFLIHADNGPAMRLATYKVAAELKVLEGRSTDTEELAEKLWAFINRDRPLADKAEPPPPSAQPAPADSHAPPAIPPASPPSGGDDMGMESQDTGGGIRAVATPGKAPAGTATKK